jgi:hypothetical protein
MLSKGGTPWHVTRSSAELDSPSVPGCSRKTFTVKAFATYRQACGRAKLFLFPPSPRWLKWLDHVTQTRTAKCHAGWYCVLVTMYPATARNCVITTLDPSQQFQDGGTQTARHSGPETGWWEPGVYFLHLEFWKQKSKLCFTSWD